MSEPEKPAKKPRARHGSGDRPPSDNDPKFSKDIADRLVAILRRGNFREMACAQVGISSRALREWLSKAANGDERYTAFAIALEQAEAEAEDILVVSIRRAALKNWQAAAWLLERRGAKRWGFRAQVELSVEEELARIVDVIEHELGGEAAARVYARLSDGAPSTPETRGAGQAESGPPSGNPIH
jgi:hypothetical protein